MVSIYKITNLINGNFYIGASNNVKRRTRQHFLRNPYGHSKLFDDEIKKFGRKSFTVEVLEECEEAHRNDREQYYINKLRPAYNVICRGSSRDKDFCESVSVGTKKWWAELPKETQQKIIKQLTGQPKGHVVSKETRQKISKKLAGRKIPRDIVEKQRAGVIAYWQQHKRPPTRGNSKKVVCDGVLYSSMKSLAQAINGTAAAIAKAARRDGRYKGHEVKLVV